MDPLMDEENDPIRRERLDTPLPREPYALFPVGGYSGPEGFDFLIHHDIETEAQCVLLFESIVDAFTVAEEYKKATGKDAEAKPIDIRGVEDRFWVKFYRADGEIFICPLQLYRDRAE